MSKKILFFAILIFCNFFFVNSAKIEINTQIYETGTFFEYLISFNESENFNSFSFEKPKDAKMIYVLDSGFNVDYSSAGDYFIIKPDGTSGKNFSIKFLSIVKSEEIIKNNIFSMYLNFNFPVESLNHKLILKDNFKLDVIEVVPRSYEIDQNGVYKWEIKKINEDTYFLIKFGDKNLIKNNSIVLFIKDFWYIILLILLFLIFLAILFKKTNRNMINIEKIKFNPFKKENNNNVIDEEKFNELSLKYLTENEREVLNVIKNNQGISQYDILNQLSKVSKSNLSKIITKLETKQFVNRIKVGKINKIYLGEKISTEIDTNNSDSKE